MFCSGLASLCTTWTTIGIVVVPVRALSLPILYKPPILAFRNVAEGSCFPKLAVEAQRSTGVPAVAGVSNATLAGNCQQHQKTVPRNQPVTCISTNEGLNRAAQKLRVIVVII